MLASLVAQLGTQPAEFDLPAFLQDQQRFQEQLTDSRWSANPLPYVDGLSSAVLQHPYAVLCDPADGTIFVTSFTLDHVVRLRMTSRKTAQYKIFVRGAELDAPVGMAIDDERHLYVASFTNDHILRVHADSGELLGTFGNDTEMDCPEGIALGPDGTLYVVSFLLPYVVRYQPQTGQFLGQFAPPRATAAAPRRGVHMTLPVGWDGGVVPAVPAAPAVPAMRGAEDLAFDAAGDLHVTAYHSSAVFKFNGSTGALESTYAQGVVRGPVGITCGPDGDMYVASYRDNQVLRFAPSGRFVGVAAGATSQRLGGKRGISGPAGITFADDGTFFVTSHVAGSLTRFNATSLPVRTWRVTGAGG